VITIAPFAACSYSDPALVPSRYVEPDRDEEDQSSEDELIIGRHVQDAHAVVQTGHDQGADDRSEHRPFASHETGASDDGG